jgi:hypothetical protein
MLDMLRCLGFQVIRDEMGRFHPSVIGSHGNYRNGYVMHAVDEIAWIMLTTPCIVRRSGHAYIRDALFL